MAFTDHNQKRFQLPTRVSRARRPLDQAYASLSLLFLVALAAVVFVGVIQASPSITESGIGWSLDHGETGTAYLRQVNDSPGSIGRPDQIGFERQLYGLVNQARVLRGLPPLRKDSALTDSARAHSRTMAASQRLETIDAVGNVPEQRAAVAGFVPPGRVLELIGQGFRQPSQFMSAVQGNSSALARLLDPDVNQVGVGYAFDATEKPFHHFWTIDLGRKSGLDFVVVVNNGSESTTSGQVTLSIGGKGWATEMQISNSPDFEDAQWEPYAEVKVWTVSEGTGPKKIYIRLRGPDQQEFQMTAEIALMAAAKGVKPGAPYDDATQAPRPPALRVPAGDLPLTGVLPSDAPAIAPSVPSLANSLSPSYYQTSEFLFGKVVVGIVMPQCNGDVDKCSETWTPAAMDAVVKQVSLGTKWWTERMKGQVSFVFDPQRQVATGYEPIEHSQLDEKLWVGDVMTHLGFAGVNYFEQVYAYNNWMRQKYDTDWAFTLFVANSVNNKGGTFSNGFFAYSYVPGPFTVMTYDNDGYTINNMAAVVAHETGHIFGALDQYAGAKIACTATSGYLTLQNQNSQQNCPSNVDSIMRGGLTPYTNRLIDPFALGMVGNRVSGKGDLPDPINTTPVVSLKPVPSPVSQKSPTITGTAQDQPYVPPSGNSITINRITSVKYRVDGGAWQEARPSDGSASFNKVSQDFSFAPVLSNGTHLIEVQAANRVGNVSQIAGTNVTVQGAAPAAVSDALRPTLTRVPITPAPVSPTPSRALPAGGSSRRSGLTIAINAGSTAISVQSSGFSAASLIADVNAQGGSATEIEEWTGNEWRAYAVNGAGTDLTLRPGSGYIIKAAQSSAWTLPADSGGPFQPVPIEAGWTMLGTPPCPDGAPACHTASTLAGAINAQGGDVVEIDRLTDGEWSAYRVGYTFNDFVVNVGEAYFVRSTKAVLWLH